MNFLGHLFLAGDDPELVVGGLMGDFVKGRLTPGRFPEGISRGIALHRRIDSAAGRNLDFLASKHRLDGRFGLYRGVLVDLFYDHFLAREWERYHPDPLAEFIARCHRQALAFEEILPSRLAGFLPAIFTELLPSYREPAGIERALQRMAARRDRPSPLAEGAGELGRHYQELKADFQRFLPAMAAEVERFLAGEPNP